jgi:spermidine/putrescine transport system substrate-binding protein
MTKLRIFLLALLLTGLLAACGEGAATTAPTADTAAAPTTAPAAEATTAPATEATAAPAGGAVDKSRLSPELRVFAWGEYIPEDVPAKFEAEYGVKVTVDTYSSNEEMAAKIRAGNSGYDVVQPSDYMVALLAEGGYLAEINKANIPNIANLNPENMGLYYDPENKYSLPYMWGTTGIAYDTTQVTPAPDSWAALFDPAQVEKYKGRVSMLNDEREAIGAALRFVGKEINSTDPADLELAKQALLAQKPLLAKYNSDNVYQDLASGEVVLAQSWSGYTGLAMIDNPNIAWVIPKEGGVIWQDNLAIVKGTPNQYTAEVFIDFLLRPDIGASIAEFTSFLSPNTRAEPLVSPELQELYKVLKPDAATLQRLEWLRKGENATLYSDIWAAVKSQ